MKQLTHVVLAAALVLLVAGAVQPKKGKSSYSKNKRRQLITTVAVKLRSNDLEPPRVVTAVLVKLLRSGDHRIEVTYPPDRPGIPVANMLVLYRRNAKTHGRDCAQEECWEILAVFHRAKSEIKVTTETEIIENLSGDILVASWVRHRAKRTTERLAPLGTYEMTQQLTFESSLELVIQPRK